MKPIITLLICVLVSNTPTLAQSINRFSIQAGYLYSTPKLIETSTMLIGHPDIKSIPGYYVGLTYEHQGSSLLTSGLDLTYQQKGYISQIPYINPASIISYHYLSLTPMVGVRPIRNFSFLLGPQVNLLLNKSTSGLETQTQLEANRRFELGLLGRASYQFYRVGLTASYFKGLTPYYKSNFWYLTNQNWQLGLFYQLTRKR